MLGKEIICLKQTSDADEVPWMLYRLFLVITGISSSCMAASNNHKADTQGHRKGVNHLQPIHGHTHNL
jgi:hypothetical protein